MTEQQPYEVLHKYAEFEVRDYPAHVLAEVTVEAPFEDAGNRAFRTLLGYITGRNISRQSIAMTAPVLTEPGLPEQVAMTAPVIQVPDPTGAHTVAFVLPASMTIDTAPEPTDPRVRIRSVPQATVAAIRYSGRWSKSAYAQHCATLLKALQQHGLTPVGQPRFARFDPPFKPWFLRRNEVLIDLA